MNLMNKFNRPVGIGLPINDEIAENAMYNKMHQMFPPHPKTGTQQPIIQHVQNNGNPLLKKPVGTVPDMNQPNNVLRF